MQYGVEAFAPSRHIKKAGNQAVKEDESLEFEVIEFSKDSKRIIVSHTNTWKAAEKAKGEAEDKSRDKARKNASKAVKKINQNAQATTLGELDALSELRAQFEQAEKGKPAKAAPKAEAKKEEPAAPVAETSGKDLKDIAGVGPAAIKKMNALGINSVADLVALNEEKIAALVEQDSKTSADQWNKWVEGAKAL
jgi:predicted flap endonuclease-1-like 5' DNA nuclease